MDAGRLANKFGLAGRINMICMIVFFRLANVIPLDDAVVLLKAAIRQNYSYKGEEVVQKNIDLLDTVVGDPTCLRAVEIPPHWRTITDNGKAYEDHHLTLIDDEKVRKFMADIGDPVTRLEGDDIPISKFLENNLLGGVMIPGTSKYEKRKPNPTGKIPKWEPGNCAQCNQCVFVCPHAAIRPFIVTKDEAGSAASVEHFETLKATGAELAGKRYTLQVSILDCTGCNACVEACPETPRALKMGAMTNIKELADNWDYATSLPSRGDFVDKASVRGSQFQTPLMEFSGACSGCGETPYFKLLTQLFGQRMVIANATGCSTIWGGSFPSNPYTVHPETGRGPAWANSLFEDNAEYGLGMFTAMKHRRDHLVACVEDYVHLANLGSKNLSTDEEDLASILRDWLEIKDDKSDKPTQLFDRMKPLFENLLTREVSKHSLLRRIWSERDMFPKISQWITGGDGWAYDIGFGGLDHIQAFEANDVNVLVADTEMYSNTGGQASKSTPVGASAKFAVGGKQQKRKNLSEMFMTYEHVYVASVALHNQAQVLQAMLEADKHSGPSIIIAYAPCIQQGVRPQGLNDMIEESRFAVDSGYWPLYRFNPELIREGKNPFILDSRKLRKDVKKFLQRENRFINLRKKSPGLAEELWESMNYDVRHRMEHLQQIAKGYKAFESPTEASVLTLFASETGHAQGVAEDFADACALSDVAYAMDDVELDDIDGKTTVMFIATCGQGAMPRNGKRFLKELQSRSEAFKNGTRFMVFGLGDSSYFFFLKAAKDVEASLIKLGAERILDLGVGDDSAEGGLEEGLGHWKDRVWPALEVPAPSIVPHIVPIKASFSECAVLSVEEENKALQQFFYSDGVRATQAPVISNDRMCRPDYDRDFRTIRLGKSGGLSYELGDALEIWPRNDQERVGAFLHEYTSEYGEHTVIELHAFGIHGKISLGSLFMNVLDLFGKPTKHFMQQLATFETDETQRQTMLDPDFLQKATKESGMTLADALLRFKQAHPPLPTLLSMIPVIKPRAYSIASAPETSESYIELLVLIKTWWCDNGMRYGLNCDMLRQLQAGDNLWCRIHPGSMEPPTPQQPVICAGIGSGLAPHMAFLRDHVRAVEMGQVVGPFSLFFGNRFEKEEFLYEEELKSYANKYEWFHLHTAFSRDDPNKRVYVQDLVAATDDARFLKERPDGMLYVCGNRNLPAPLQDALVQSFSNRSGKEEDVRVAQQAVQDLYLTARAQQEVW